MSAEIQFVVEGLLKSQGYVLARICEPADFSLTSSATLNNIPILPILQQPRALDALGQQRCDIFAFVLRRQSDIRYFKENETVHLRI
jgi:hypothetical protein